MDLLLKSGTSENEEDQKETRKYLSIEDYLVSSFFWFHDTFLVRFLITRISARPDDKK